MAISANSGPLVSYGQATGIADSNPDMAPSLFWGGAGLLDPRPLYTYYPGGRQSARSYGFLGGSSVMTLSAVPYTVSTTGSIVAAANPTSDTLTLVSSSSATTGVYITPSVTNALTGVVDTNGGAGLVALDAYASVTASISAGVLTVTVNGTMPLTPGMMLLTSSGTVSSGTVAGTMITAQLTGSTGSVGFTGTYQTNNPALTATSGTVTLAIQNPFQCAVPYGKTPSIYMWNPMALVGRAVSVKGATGATRALATVSGYDIYGYPMVEAITITPNTTVNGKKAFKYIKSVVLSGGTGPDTTHNYQVDTTNIYGLPLRSDSYGDVTANYAASATLVTGIAAATTYLPADLTTATATTGDVRGTFGAFTAVTGSSKLVIRQSIAPYNIGSTVGLFGVAQYAG